MFTLFAYAMIVVGILMFVGGTIWQIVMAFQKNPIWGAISIVACGVGNALWCALNMKEGWRPLVTALGGIPLIVLGMLMVSMETAVAVVQKG